MYLSVNKRCVTSFSVICRYFRTQSVNLFPRGATNIERRHVKPVKIENESEPPTPLSPHRDTRPVDSVDPVILKYVNLLKDLEDESKGVQEKVHVTNFGTVRFDNDNVPSIHGQFDSIEGPEIASVDGSFLSKPVVQSQSEALKDEVQEINSETQKVVSESEKAFEELFCSNVSDSEMPVEEVAYRPSRLSPSSMKTEVISNDKDVGFIDEQFFNDAETQYSNHSTSNSPVQHQSASPSKDVDFTKNFDAHDVGSMDDFNYIDQTFFKSSFEVLRENREPVVEFSEMKKDLEKAFDRLSSTFTESSILNEGMKKDTQEENALSNANYFKQEHAPYVSNIALDYLGLDPSTVSPKFGVFQKEEKKPTPPIVEPPPKTAYDYVLKKRKELHDSEFGFGAGGGDPGSKSHQKVLSLLRERTKDAYTKKEILSLLKKSIIYNKHDIVGLYKPYGIAMHEGTTGPHHILSEFLPELAHHLKVDDLATVYRLDATTTGVLLLACTPTMAKTLKAMFKEQQIKKTYWAITKGIPSPLQGLIDIPIAEGKIDGKHRMVLRPDVKGLRGSSDQSHMAITGFRVISSCYNSALVELTPKTGVKHQVRVHLGFGLACPILGDHKYSHLKKLAPQRLSGDMLERLKLKQSKVRNMPLFLHSRSVLIPEIVDGRNIFIKAKIPAFFNKTLSILKLNTYKNQVRHDGSNSLDE